MKIKSNSMKRGYWLTFDAKDLVSKLEGVDDTYRNAGSNPLVEMWRRNTYAYYSTIFSSESWMTALQFTGEQGELVKMNIPQARSLIRDAVTLTTKQKLAFQALAQAEGSQVNENMRIANALAAEILEKQTLDLKNELMVEHGFVLGTGFMGAKWRSDRGKPRAVEVIDVDDEGNERKNVIYDGDVEISVPLVFDILYDWTIQQWDDVPWVKERVKRNRWDLIEQHPELEEEIIKLPSCLAEDKSRSYFGLSDLEDMVYVHEIYVRPSPALPRGRMLFYANPKTIFFDDENIYGTLPIEQYKPEPLMAINAGYPLLSSLLPSQEMYDHEFSAIATNHAAFAVQNVAVPRGANIDVQQLLGMNFVDYTPQPIDGGGKPTPLELTKTSAEVFKLPEMLLQNMQAMSRISAAVRGDLPASTSGVAIATLTTNALEFFSGYAKADQDVLKKTMLGAINAVRKFSRVEKIVTIVGKNNQRFSKPYDGKMLEPITGFEMQMVNPMLQTMAGRIDIAEKMVTSGLVKNVQGYVSIIDGQPLSQLYKPELSENDLIESENEMMSEGQEVPVLSADNHALHIFMHKVLLNNPRVRMSGKLTAIVNDHMLKHLELQQSTSPLFMAMANTGMVPQQPMGAPTGPMEQPGQAEQQNEQGAPVGAESELMGEEMPMAEAEPAQPAQDLLERT